LGARAFFWVLAHLFWMLGNFFSRACRKVISEQLTDSLTLCSDPGLRIRKHIIPLDVFRSFGEKGHFRRAKTLFSIWATLLIILFILVFVENFVPGV
jgi:hypothetical protein